MSGRIRFILASASPARLKTLRGAGIEPEVIVSTVDESKVTADSASVLAGKLAGLKANEVRDRVVGQALVLGCDSLLEFEGQALGKPHTYDVAVDRWRRMRGGTGVLHTGHLLIEGQLMTLAIASTTVHFADVSDEEIELYCRTGEPNGVAGGFTIDGLGGWFVDAVEGDPHNVVGLSLPTLRMMLAEHGYSIADLGYPVR